MPTNYAGRPLPIPPEAWRQPAVLDALRARPRDAAALLRIPVRYGAPQQHVSERILELSGVHIPQNEISKILAGRRSVTAIHLFEAIADGLQMPDDARVALGLAPRGPRAGVPSSSMLLRQRAGSTVWVLEDPLEIARRMASRDPGRLDDAVVERAEAFLIEAVSQYELVSPAEASGRLVRQRRWVEELLTDGPRPRLRHERRLYRVAAGLSGLLGHLAVLVGRHDVADAYMAEAWQLATEVDSDELYAWVRGTQSFAFYSRGNYQAAWEAAHDGRRYAGRGPQAVRLAVNGEARALGHLGDEVGVASAVDDALTIAGELPAPASLTSGLSFDRYDDARIDGNAATAYVALGDGPAAQEHAERAIAVFDRGTLHAPRVLTRLDLAASALLRGENRDPERAAVVAEQAIQLAADRPTETIRHRLVMFASVVRRADSNPALERVMAMARELPATPGLPDDEET